MNPFATVLFDVCSSVTVECCVLYPLCVGVFGIFAVIEGSSPVWNASPRGPMCFRCLMFSLSGACELLFLLCFIASWT